MTREGQGSDIRTVVVPRSSDIGGFTVQRALPAGSCRMVGPFVFLDQMGPAVLGQHSGLDVAPHPHIGLATVTWLFSGELVHRDSLGSVQTLRPGALNWMTAGRGIVHSERTPGHCRDTEHTLFGLQAWVALPQPDEETAPDFVHHDAATLPVIEGEGVHLRLIAGSLFGRRAPVRTFQDLFYADATLDPGATLELQASHEERAVYLVEGAIVIGNRTYAAPGLVVFKPDTDIALHAPGSARLMLLGGDAMDGRRYVWWNFVASSRERIEQAKEDWRQGRFADVPGETERLPLPGETWPEVNYP